MAPLLTVGPLLLLSILLLSLLTGCSDNGGKHKPKKRPHLVETVAVVRDSLSVTRQRSGTLRARREVQIHTQEEGAILSLPYYEGDLVSKGDVIVRLDDKLLRAQLNKARASLSQAQLDLKRLNKLSKKRLVSNEQVVAAQTQLELARADVTVLKTRLGYTTILAPFDGVISKRLTEPGNVVEKHSLVLTISDPASLITELAVSELLLPHLKVGDATEVRIDALGDTLFNGRIIRIHPDINPLTRRGIVEVELNPVPDKAQPGQLSRVILHTRAAERLVIPFSALRRDELGEYVFVVSKQNKARRQTVKSALRLADRVEIIDGLTAGQQVIIKGFLGLGDGKPVQLVNSARAASASRTNAQ